MPEPGRLFELDYPVPEAPPAAEGFEGRVVRVLPDVSGVEREFDYVVPHRWQGRVEIGSLVRVDLHRRRVAGWVTEVDVEPPAGIRLLPIERVSSVGPTAEVIDLARWAAHRWHGPLRAVLTSASPPRMVASRPSPRTRPRAGPGTGGSPAGPDGPGRRSETEGREPMERALTRPGVSVIQTGPADDGFDLAARAAAIGNSLILVPSVGGARRLAGRLGREGVRTHLQPGGWSTGSVGGAVIGTRSAVWAPSARLDVVVVLDEHDESYQEERVPTWHAREVAVERARRHRCPCVLVSPAPSLPTRARVDEVLRPARTEERRGWPAVEVVDRRGDEPGLGLFSRRAAELLRESERAVAVLNRKGRARMLVCSSCGEVVTSEDGEHLMVEVDGRLEAPATGETRPVVCAICGGTTLKRLRLGVTRAAEELSRLVGRDVIELSADKPSGELPATGPCLVLGTEAALHAAGGADVVAFLDFDQELRAPRYRAGEQALWLLARAARVVGGRRPESRLLIQTRSPEHRVVRAALAADPGRMVDEELATRASMGWPPLGAVAEVSGAGASEFAAAISAVVADAGSGQGPPDTTLVLGPRDDGRYLVRADDPDRLADVLARAEPPKARFRVAVDPPRI